MKSRSFSRSTPNPLDGGFLARLRRNLRRFAAKSAPDDPGCYGSFRRVENPFGATDFVVVTAIDAKTGEETDLAVAAQPRAK